MSIAKKHRKTKKEYRLARFERVTPGLGMIYPIGHEI